uniref:Uncharacterized protein n=1 Tax=Oryza brachyantha TaxID=4533 RepID=J3NF25_ORYBR
MADVERSMCKGPLSQRQLRQVAKGVPNAIAATVVSLIIGSSSSKVSQGFVGPLGHVLSKPLSQKKDKCHVGWSYTLHNTWSYEWVPPFIFYSFSYPSLSLYRLSSSLPSLPKVAVDGGARRRGGMVVDPSGGRIPVATWRIWEAAARRVGGGSRR